MFKKIFQRLYCIIVQPTKEWRVLADEEVVFDKFLATYFHPLIGIITLAAFVGSILSSHSVEMALKASIQEIVTYFAGFYLASLLLKEVINRKFTTEYSNRSSYFVVYASSPIYLISIVASLFGSGFWMIYLFLPYTIYIIWEGATIYMGIKEEEQMRFSAICMPIVLVPYFIGFVMNKFMFVTP